MFEIWIDLWNSFNYFSPSVKKKTLLFDKVYDINCTPMIRQFVKFAWIFEIWTHIYVSSKYSFSLSLHVTKFFNKSHGVNCTTIRLFRIFRNFRNANGLIEHPLNLFALMFQHILHSIIFDRVVWKGRNMRFFFYLPCSKLNIRFS